ncbi:MAG: VacJ family lipoprotein [Marinagarivorans sp.]|nr:VacJ family lipoprotein [Marinagarivorans sp.]
MWKLWVGSFFFSFLAVVAGCATGPSPQDPYENMNRVVFTVNDTLDTYIAKPVAKGYRSTAPEFVERGVGNFFGNLGEVTNVINDVLQGKWIQASYDGSRFLLNTLAGLGGLVDVANVAGLEKSQGEDFAQTLRYWGLPAGPYIVLPILGPSTATDIISIPADWATTPLTYLEAETWRYRLTALEYTDKRKNLLDAEALMSGDKYIFIREAYLQSREFSAQDGAVEDDFGGDLDDLEGF